jgi:16S rRNA (guanine1207-N2)-methyltransferase
MEQITQIILRNRDRISSGRILLINPARDTVFREIGAGRGEISLFTQDHGDYRWLQGAGANVEFGVVPASHQSHEQIILRLPREKPRLEMMLHCACELIAPRGRLWLVGEKRSGIKSSVKYLSQYFENTIKIDNARHCMLYESSSPQHEKTFKLADYRQHWSQQVGAKKIKLISLPGAFSHGRLDNGTRLLIETLEAMPAEQRPAGRVLDFGCGTGVIGLSLLARDPSVELTLLDSSAIALESARLSLQANVLSATLRPSEGLSEVESRFDWIVSNPPFHRGVSSDLDIARAFFESSGRALTKKGKMVLVCNRHLPYAKWLQDYFTNVETIRSDRDFNILCTGVPRV